MRPRVPHLQLPGNLQATAGAARLRIRGRQTKSGTGTSSLARSKGYDQAAAPRNTRLRAPRVSMRIGCCFQMSALHNVGPFSEEGFTRGTRNCMRETATPPISAWSYCRSRRAWLRSSPRTSSLESRKALTLRWPPRAILTRVSSSASSHRHFSAQSAASSQKTASTPSR